MLGECKTLFNNQFFEDALQREALNNQDFVIKYFTQDARISENEALTCFVGVKGQRFDGNDFFDQAYKAGVRVFLLSKNPQEIPVDAIIYQVDDTLEALGRLAHLHKNNLKIASVLITGSVGKTTTRSMLTAVLREKYTVHTAKKNWNNAIGLPLTILETDPDAKILVLEGGMSSKGEIAHLSRILNPEIAIITNIGLSHSEFLGSIDQVAEAKIEIVEGMGQDSVLLINKHDPYRELFESRAKGKVEYFDPTLLSITEDKGLEGFSFIHRDYLQFTFFCPIPGEHLLLNLSIIFALTDLLQIPLDCIQRGLLNIQGLDNRMRIFQTKKNISVIADCYNASLESFKAALDVLKKAKGRKIAVVGSILELGNQTESIHRQIGNYLNETQPDLILALGEEIAYTCQELTIPYCHFLQKEDLWSVLEKELQEGDTVLVKGSNGTGLAIIVQCLEQGGIRPVSLE